MARGKRKPARVCACGTSLGKSFYPQCNPCRARGCAHTRTHYDSKWAKVCDDCGSQVGPALKKKTHTLKRGAHPLTVGFPS